MWLTHQTNGVKYPFQNLCNTIWIIWLIGNRPTKENQWKAQYMYQGLLWEKFTTAYFIIFFFIFRVCLVANIRKQLNNFFITLGISLPIDKWLFSTRTSANLSRTNLRSTRFLFLSRAKFLAVLRLRQWLLIWKRSVVVTLMSLFAIKRSNQLKFTHTERFLL